MKKCNCWEFMNCGRDVGGNKVDEVGLCPATTDTSADGINGGKNGGRICWSVAGLLSPKRECTTLMKQTSCINCDFFRLVNKEEGDAKFKFLLDYHSN